MNDTYRQNVVNAICEACDTVPSMSDTLDALILADIACDDPATLKFIHAAIDSINAKLGAR